MSRVSTVQPAGSQLRVKVVGVNAKNKKSKPATVAVNLPDLTAPHGTYQVSSVDNTGTITVVSDRGNAPRKGAEISVKGRFESLFSLGRAGVLLTLFVTNQQTLSLAGYDVKLPPQKMHKA